MHASTASGKEGDSAWLETKRMSPTRKCHNQCLQFYYYHTGNEADQLNIWIREFQDEQDVKGTLRLMGQITGSPKSYWQLHHVSLNATKHFQVVFESRKGAGSSSGGFSIDDINLSETECPHLTMQINDFGNLFNTSGNARIIYSSRQYSRGGYAYRIGIVLDKSFFGLFVQLLSGKYDDQLEWPCVNRQVTFQMVDQNPNIQQQMSKQRSITTDLRQFNNGVKNNFQKVSSEFSTTNGVPYDYWSVMHYGKNAFSNGNGSTIITKDPKFQDVIGQRKEISPSDVLELNRLYKCNSAIAFKMHCSFSNGGMCQMNRCSQNGTGWQMVMSVSGGPNSDHTNLPEGSGVHSGQDAGYFMHAGTASGKEGDSAWLETKRMSPTRKCHNQCLQFYYYYTGNEADQLNIWIREFQDEQDVKGALRLMGQITDITPLVNGSALPCPEVGPVEVKHPPTNRNGGPCATRIFTTIKPPPKTTDDDRILTTKPPPKTTDDDSIFGVSPGLEASPVLTLLVALMLVIHR
ncbi:Meprin A subunit beta [Larimichthys crocea]|uniref:Metalloendopeptidase n=1 Tax=Larimichthys crocea TaxID=215358 RepID=A0A6G0ICM5_LARCR|nr:Meprin A subunit beta [Larimichthys crocea]